MSANPLEVVHSIYAAMATGDAPSVVASLHPEIVWNEAEGFVYADRNPYIGPASIGE